jgi:hypothetical protein
LLPNPAGSVSELKLLGKSTRRPPPSFAALLLESHQPSRSYLLEKNGNGILIIADSISECLTVPSARLLQPWSYLTSRPCVTPQRHNHYLVALARKHGFALATFDEALAGTFGQETDLVRLVR